MMPMSRVQIRTMIIFGFVLSAVAEVFLTSLIHDGRLSVRFVPSSRGPLFGSAHDHYRGGRVVVADPMKPEMTGATHDLAPRVSILPLQYVLFAATFNSSSRRFTTSVATGSRPSLWFDLLAP